MNDQQHDGTHQPPDDDRRWLDEPRNVTKVVIGLAIVCGLALIADLFYGKHPHFSFEGWFAFYPIYGLIGSLMLVLTAKQLRKVLMRSEDYYEGRFFDDDGDRDRDGA